MKKDWKKTSGEAQTNWREEIRGTFQARLWWVHQLAKDKEKQVE